jgi:hypothetical protein
MLGIAENGVVFRHPTGFSQIDDGVPFQGLLEMIEYLFYRHGLVFQEYWFRRLRRMVRSVHWSSKVMGWIAVALPPSNAKPPQEESVVEFVVVF